MQNSTFFSFAESGKKLYASFLSALGLMMIFICSLAFGQTNPTPFALSGGSFSFTAQTPTNTTYPTNMQGWTTGANNITAITTAVPGADQALIASGAANTSGLSNLGANGFNLLSTGSSPNMQVGEISVALNSAGRNNLLVTWTAADQTTGSTRQMNLTLQYRLGTTGTFTTVTGSTYTTSNTNQAAAQTFTNISLPSACDNQPVVQLRWVSYESVAQTGGRDAIRLDDITVSSSVAGPYSVQSGDWNTASTWSSNSVPLDADNVTISASNTVFTNAVLNRTGNTIVNGSFQINSGSWATGAGTFAYGSAGTLIFNNDAASGSYGVNAADVYWPSLNGPMNVIVLGAGGITMNTARIVPSTGTAGTFLISAGSVAGAALTLNGTAQINGGSFTTTPSYGSFSTLVYNTSYGVYNEWTGNSSTAGIGVPNNITIQNSAVVTTPAGSVRGMAGNLNVISGTLSLGNDIYLAGNWTNAGTFTPNNKAVYFNGTTGTQLITNTASETFAYLIHNGTSLLKFNNDVTVNGDSGDVLQLLAGTIDLNAKKLTLSGSGGNVKVVTGQILNSSVAGAIFNITGTSATKYILGGTLSIPINVTTVLNNGIDFGNNITTIAGILRIAAGGFVSTNPPVYTNTSTLEYNGVTGYGIGSEWTAGGGATTTQGFGIPYMVNLENSTVNMPNSARGLANKLTIGSGTITTPSVLNMNNTLGADLYIGGDWSDRGTFNHNNRAVFFNGGTATQLISNALGTETFAYLINLKPTGTKIMLNSANVNIVGTGPGALTLKGTGDLDITNLNLSIKNGGSVIVDGGVRNITSSLATAGNFIIDGATTVVSQNSGTLVINSKIPTILNNSINFGPNITTINGSLIVKPNGTATSSPIYGSSATLEYNTTGNTTTPHQAAQEWSGNIGTTTHAFTAAAGVPPTVKLVGATVQQFAGEVSTKDLIIDATSKLIQDPTANYNDLKLFGNLTNNGTITGNSRTVIFQGAATQIISGATTPLSLSNIKINNSTAATAVTTSVDINLSGALDLVLGKFALTTKNLTANTTTTPDNYANSFVVTGAAGQLKLPVSNVNVVFPIGNLNTSYTPITVSNSGTADTYGFNVRNTVPDVTTDLPFMVQRSWVVTEGTSGGGNLKVVPQWNKPGDEGTSFGAADAFIQLYTSPSLVSEYPATVNYATVSTATLTNAANNFSNSLPTSGATTYFAVGKHKPQEIDVLGNSVSIANNDNTPSTTDDTDFGNVMIDNVVTKTYTIKNLGQVSLTVNSIVLSGSSDFALSGLPTFPLSIPGGGSTNFNVVFTPTTVGTITSTITINNNDTDEGTYTFGVQGNANLCAKTSEVIYKSQDFEGTTPLTNVAKWPATISTSPIAVGTLNAYGSNLLTQESISIGNAALYLSNYNTLPYKNITTTAIDASSFTNTVFSMKLGAFSLSNGNGIDDSDQVTISVKTGASPLFKDIMTITGKGITSQNIWGFDATGIAAASYNVASAVSFVASGNATNTGPQLTPDGFSTIKITDIPNVAGLQIKVTLNTNNSNEYWAVDNMKLYSEPVESTKTWNGTTWVGGAPSVNDVAIIDGDYNTDTHGSFASCKCQVNSGKTLTISPSTSIKDNSVTAKYDLNNGGNVLVQSDGNLIQKKNNIIPNSGNITVQRDVKIKDARTEYNYLGSPVTFAAGQDFKKIYPGIDFVLYHNQTNNRFYNSSGVNIPGRGLAVKEPNKSATGIPAGIPKATATFIGVPQNGDIEFGLANSNSGTITGLGYNLIGNPYPSNIDLQALYNINGGKTSNPQTSSPNISATFYFWDNNANDLAGQTQQGSSYSGQAYAVYNALAGNNGTGTAAAGYLTGNPTLGSKKPTNIVKVAQGFMTRSLLPNYALKFNNTIRTASPAPDDFLGKNPQEQQEDRYWLNLISPANVVSSIAIIHYPGGNNSLGMEDSESRGGSDELYSQIGDTRASINGREAFVNTDVIPLGSRQFTTGNYKISVAEREGIFATGQNIYLKDRQTGIITNLSEGGYTFSANAGESTGRFEIVYKPGAVLATDTAVKEELVVYRNGDSFIVKAQSNRISTVEVYDALGRLIRRMEPVSTVAVIDGAMLPGGTYLLKIIQDKRTTVKKIIK